MRRFTLFFFLSVVFVIGTLTGQWGVAVKAAQTEQPLPVEKMRELAEAIKIIKRDYVEEVSVDELMAAAIRGMVNSLDPHSLYLDADNLKSLESSLVGEQYGGVGIYIGTKDGWVEIISPIDGSPASRAGLQAGDLILKIEDISTQRMKIEDAVGMMRGKVGDILHLDILSLGEGEEPRTVELRRETIVTPSALAALVEKDYGYLRVSRFQQQTVGDLVKQLNTLYRENKRPLKGLVMDLRNNPGGILDTSVGVASIFLPVGAVVVSDRGRESGEKKFKVSANYYGALNNINEIKSVPMVVLVNSGSASASEIVAGALQDHRRAVLMGTRTYGKASVQTVRRLNATKGKTGIKYTIARYYTPSGRSIQARSIEPDVIVQQGGGVKEEKKDFAIREANLSQLIRPLERRRPRKRKRKTEKIPSFVPKNDYQFDQAIVVLKALG